MVEMGHAFSFSVIQGGTLYSGFFVPLCGGRGSLSYVDLPLFQLYSDGIHEFGGTVIDDDGCFLMKMVAYHEDMWLKHRS